MTPCLGLFGRIFGHKFHRFLLRQEGPANDYQVFWTSGMAQAPVVSKSEYAIRCQRCGMEAPK